MESSVPHCPQFTLDMSQMAFHDWAASQIPHHSEHVLKTHSVSYIVDIINVTDPSTPVIHCGHYTGCHSGHVTLDMSQMTHHNCAKWHRQCLNTYDPLRMCPKHTPLPLRRLDFNPLLSVSQNTDYTIAANASLFSVRCKHIPSDALFTI